MPHLRTRQRRIYQSRIKEKTEAVSVLTEQPLFLCFLLFLFFHRIPEYDKLLIDKLGHKVDHHVDAFHQPVMNTGVGKKLPPPAGERCESQIIQRYEQHGLPHIGGGVECKFPVKRKIPQNAEHERRKVAEPVLGKMQDIVKKSETCNLHKTC